MNIIELQKKLHDLGVHESSYSIGDGFGDEQYCLQKIGGKWHYYYSERGQKSGEKIFDNEHDACEYMYTILDNDPTVKS